MPHANPSRMKKLTVVAPGGRIVCDVCHLADKPHTRLRGIMGWKSLRRGEGLLLRPTFSIHTAFVRFPIDAVFLDKEMTVVAISHELKPWRFAGARGRNRSSSSRPASASGSSSAPATGSGGRSSDGERCRLRLRRPGRPRVSGRSLWRRALSRSRDRDGGGGARSSSTFPAGPSSPRSSAACSSCSPRSTSRGGSSRTGSWCRRGSSSCSATSSQYPIGPRSGRSPRSPRCSSRSSSPWPRGEGSDGRRQARVPPRCRARRGVVGGGGGDAGHVRRRRRHPGPARVEARKQTIPFGPFLVLGALVALFLS